MWPMNEADWLAARFEENRGHLRAVAYRMLGSASEADDAVQEAWLRLNRSYSSDIGNLGGWLTTAVGRVCLDMLRTRRSRREDPLDPALAAHAPDGPDRREDLGDPEQRALLADSVGLALLVVLETLDPAERLAFVLHDMFAVPFDEIAPIVDRSPAAARQLASRARRRVQGTDSVADPDLSRQREVVDAFLIAARGGDFDALVAVLAPDVALHVDRFALRPGAPTLVRGAENVARGAATFAAVASSMLLVLVNGSVGVLAAPEGQRSRVMTFTVEGGRISEMEMIADPQRLRELNLAILND
jgi:RNA polymerase sigma-70 factor (ECF subfamily)